MHKHFDLGYPCHIPRMCRHNDFRKDILVMYLVHDKLPKDANWYGFPDVGTHRYRTSGPLRLAATAAVAARATGRRPLSGGGRRPPGQG